MRPQDGKTEQTQSGFHKSPGAPAERAQGIAVRGLSLTTCTSGTFEDWIPLVFTSERAVKQALSWLPASVLEGGCRSEMPVLQEVAVGRVESEGG